MERMKFDSQGKLMSVDGSSFETYAPVKKTALQTSDSLEFLKEDKQIGDIFQKNFWSLYKDNHPLKPLEFSNRKTQEDLVKEIYDLINQGNKIIFLHGACGTGKSAIALNLARVLGKASVVVPVKTLQSQYEKDYTQNMELRKTSGEKMKIAMITGRENHDSIINPGTSCADPTLPDTIKITEKNYQQIKEYYLENPFINNKEFTELKGVTRMSIAPANPYWSPIISADYEVRNLRDAKKYEYMGCNGKKYIFYHRKRGCSYYDQYLAYTRADVIIFNAAKYNLELSIGRKPLTEVDIIDEADVFLDNFFEQSELNLTMLANSLRALKVDSPSSKDSIEKIRDLIFAEEKNKQALGVDESQIFEIENTKIKEIMSVINSSPELQSEIAIDETNYSNKALEIAKDFSDSVKEVYVNYRKKDENLFVKLVTTNLSYKIRDLMNKTKALVFMSGTLHSKSVLRDIFQINNYKVVEAEIVNPGTMDIVMTGKEFDCRYSNFSSGKHSRKDYLEALDFCVNKSIKPSLIHVQAFQDLPSEIESQELHNLISKEELIANQNQDSFGDQIKNFKQGNSDILFSTKCARGVDFPGDTCKSVIFTKYPNPNVGDIFWKVIKKTHPDYYWEFYKDKANREFLQRLYRAIRSKNDHVYILSPDLRVLQEVRKLQNAP